MADLRIVDAPVLLQESITDDVKMPTGGLGNYAIRLGDLVWYVVTKEQLASKSYVDTSSQNVQNSLDTHIADKANPHQVTKEQVGLGNVDNTADIDKPVSNAVSSAIITATTDMATKSYVDGKDGDLTTLNTTNKTTLVKAINEVYDKTKGVVALYDKNIEVGQVVDAWTDSLIKTQYSRTLRDKLSDFGVSVIDFGAKGDGTTDDTTATQNAVNYLQSKGGGVLRFPNRNYRVTDTIRINGKVSIVGERGAKIIVDANVEAFEIKNANGQGMTGLEIDGKDKAFYGMSIWNTEYYLIDNVYIHNTGGTDPMRGDGSGIRLIDSSFVLITRSKTVDIGGDGILTLQCKHVVIDGCYSERCKRHNYSFSEYQADKYSEHCKLINSVGIDSFLSGIDLESGVRCTVDNNTFIRSGKYINTEKGDLKGGIYTYGWAYGNRITNNTIIDSQTDGIFVVQPTDVSRTNEYGLEPVATVIADNYVLNAGQNGIVISGSGLQDNDKQSWNVHSNIIHNPTKNGIKLGWFTKNANIHNNTITNSGELAISSASNDKCNISHNNIDTNSDGISLEYSKNLIILANNININGTNKKYINVDMSGNVAENIIIANNITNADSANSATLLNIYATGGAKNIKVRDNTGVGELYPFIKFNLGDFDAQSVEIHHNGSRYYKTIGWINVSERFITTISFAPNYIGQMAIVNNIAYIAIGTASASDWKQITN